MAKAQAPAIGIDLGTTYRWAAAQCCGSATLKLLFACACARDWSTGSVQSVEMCQDAYLRPETEQARVDAWLPEYLE